MRKKPCPDRRTKILDPLILATAPTSRSSLAKACQRLETFYVEDRQKGVIISDFDELFARWPYAVFRLPDLMAGKLDRSRVSEFMQKNYPRASPQSFYLIYKEINTQGGACVAGDVNTGGADFVGRDKIVIGRENQDKSSG